MNKGNRKHYILTELKGRRRDRPEKKRERKKVSLRREDLGVWYIKHDSLE